MNKKSLLAAAFEAAEQANLPAVSQEQMDQDFAAVDAAVVSLEDIDDALNASTETIISLEEITASLEQHVTEGIDYQTGQFLHLAYESHSKFLGFESTDLPAVDCFKTNPRLATQLSVESAKDRLLQIWEAIKQLLKKFVGHMKIYMQRLMTAAKSLESRAKQLDLEAAKVKGQATGTVSIGLAEKFLVELGNEKPSITPLLTTLRLVEDLQNYERTVAGSGAEALWNILDLAKRQKSEDFFTKIESLCKIAVPRPKFIKETKKNDFGGDDGESSFQAGGVRFIYQTETLEYLKGAIAIKNISKETEGDLANFSPSNDGLAPLTKQEIHQVAATLQKIAKIMLDVGDSSAETERLVNRFASEYTLDRRSAGAEDAVIREAMKYLQTTVQKQLLLIQSVTDHVADVAKAYLTYGSKSVLCYNLDA